jgi:hypothetical protein
MGRERLTRGVRVACGQPLEDLRCSAAVSFKVAFDAGVAASGGVAPPRR